MGVVIFGILMLGLTSMFDSNLKKQKKLRDKTQFDNSFKGFGQRLQHLLKGADVATSFQLLPIRYKACDSNGPCFFTMDSKGTMGNVKKSEIGNLAGINFFRDEGVKAFDRPFLSKADPVRLKYFKKPRYPNHVKLSKSKRYFAGWKLKDVNKIPFNIISRVDFPGYFTFDDALAKSNPPDNYAVLKGSGSGLPVGELDGSLVAIYNAYNPKEYFFRKISKAGVCTPGNICVNLVKARNPALVGEYKKKFNAKNYYFLQLTEPSDVGSFISSSGVRMAGSWWKQSAKDYSFPYKMPSIYHAGHMDFRKADIHSLEHYHHTLINSETGVQIKSKFVIIPVSFKKIYLTAQGKEKKKLIMKTYEKPKLVKTILSDLPLEAEVFFSRQLSTNRVSAFVNDPTKEKKKTKKKKK